MEVTYRWPPWLRGSYHPRWTPDGMAAGRQTETEALEMLDLSEGFGFGCATIAAMLAPPAALCSDGRPCPGRGGG